MEVQTVVRPSTIRSIIISIEARCGALVVRAFCDKPFSASRPRPYQIGRRVIRSVSMGSPPAHLSVYFFLFASVLVWRYPDESIRAGEAMINEVVDAVVSFNNNDLMRFLSKHAACACAVVAVRRK